MIILYFTFGELSILNFTFSELWSVAQQLLFTISEFVQEEKMVFWERFCELCKDKGITPTQMVKEGGIAAGSVTKWKNGSIPHGNTRKKIADYFAISERDLFEGSEQKEKPAAISDELWEAMQNNPRAVALLELLLKMSPEQMDAFEKVIGRKEG